MDKNIQQPKNDDLNKQNDKGYQKDNSNNITNPGQQKDSQQTGGVKQDKNYDKKQDRTHV